ncbi:MAG: 3-oxoacid CoA-transferase subunit B [Bacteriovorax sp.]|nr:3-oxoacid CoA-transferase subunit B [Bacteriovorax sp.]
MAWTNIEMADEIILFFKPYSSVNLGIGMPTAIAERIPHELNIMIHSENGVLGVSGRPKKDSASPTLINAGKETIAIKKGASYFDSSMSFGMIRGGHIDYCVLGGMEVDVSRNLANWMVPGKKVTGMGGAMDLVNGSKQVIIMMNHFSKDGVSKLLPQCLLPFTGLDVVDIVVTELGVFKPTGTKFEIIKLAHGVAVEDLKMDKTILN